MTNYTSPPHTFNLKIGATLSLRMSGKPPPSSSPANLYPPPLPPPPTSLHATHTAETFTPSPHTILGIMKPGSLHPVQTFSLPQHCPPSLPPLPPLVWSTITFTFMQIYLPEANKFRLASFKASTIHIPHKFSFTKSTSITLIHTLTPHPPPPKTYSTSTKLHFSSLITSTTTVISGDYTLTKEAKVPILPFSCLHFAPSCMASVPYMCTPTPPTLSTFPRLTHPMPTQSRTSSSSSTEYQTPQTSSLFVKVSTPPNYRPDFPFLPIYKATQRDAYSPRLHLQDAPSVVFPPPQFQLVHPLHYSVVLPPLSPTPSQRRHLHLPMQHITHHHGLSPFSLLSPSSAHGF